MAISATFILQNLDPVTSRPSTEATHASYNTAKNRYANIPSCECSSYYFYHINLYDFVITSDDHSRVLLTEIPGRPGSDYINANHIVVSEVLCKLLTNYAHFEYFLCF